MPEHSVRLAALAATLTSQQVTQYRAGAIDGQPDAASRLAGSLNNLSSGWSAWAGGRRRWPRSRRPPASTGSWPWPARTRSGPTWPASLNNLSVRLADLGRPEEALAAIEEAVIIYRELAAARPDAFRPDLATSLDNLSNRLAEPGPAGGGAGRDRGGHRHLPRSWPRPARTRSGPTWPAR